MVPPNDPNDPHKPDDDDLEPIESNPQDDSGDVSRDHESAEDDPTEEDNGSEEGNFDSESIDESMEEGRELPEDEFSGEPDGESDEDDGDEEETELLDAYMQPPSDGGVSDDPVSDEEPEEEPEEGASAMSFLDHLEELRWTLAKCMGVFVLSCVLIGIFVFRFADLLHWPYDWAVSNYEGVNDQLYIRSFMGSFSVMFQLFFLGGISLSLPFMLFFLAQFVAPGLTKSEKRMLLPGCILAVCLFLTGAVFSFFVILPAGLRASVMFAQLFEFELLIDAPSYYGLLMWATAGVGAAFEFPLVLMILIHLGIVGTAMLRNYRRHAIVGFLILAAVVTPTPDPVTFLFLAGPLALLYEISIFFGTRIEKKRAARIAAEDAAAELEETE